jgi:hypothetical protein
LYPPIRADCGVGGNCTKLAGQLFPLQGQVAWWPTSSCLAKASAALSTSSPKLQNKRENKEYHYVSNRQLLSSLINDQISIVQTGKMKWRHQQVLQLNVKETWKDATCGSHANHGIPKLDLVLKRPPQFS